MSRLPNTLVADLLEIADGLARQSGRANLRQVALRRSISTAYYAVFHALCYVCADGLVRWSRTDLVAKTYRSLNHASARKKLAALAAQAGASTDIKRISAAFGELQDMRHDADYERPMSLFNKSEVLAQINKAREVVDLMALLDEEARRSLAVELLVLSKR